MPIRDYFLTARTDDASFDHLYLNYFTPVFRYIYYKTGQNKDTAEELTQTVFLRAFRSAEDTNKNLRLAYFLTIAKNIIIDFWRKKKELLTVDEQAYDQVDDKTSAEVRANFDRQQTIDQALAALPAEQAEMIRLKFLVGLSNEELSQIFNKTEVTLRKIQSRALKKIRDHCQAKNINW